MEKLNEVIAKNLIKYRTLFGLTQKELADKINYSDKAVSKWETGNGLPDISVLVKLSELYKITVNDLLDENVLKEEKPLLSNDEIIKKRRGIMLLSSVLAVVISAIVFYILFMIPQTTSKSWLAFIYCVPVVGIIDFIFSCLWFKKTARIVFSSIIIWGVVLTLCLTWFKPKPTMFMIVGFCFEVLDVIWFIFMEKYLKSKKKESHDSDQENVE